MNLCKRHFGNYISYKKSYLAFWVFLYFIHVAATLSTKNLSEHVKSQMQHHGNFAGNTKRYNEIYSKVTSQMLQIRGRKIDANAPQGSKWAKMAFFSVSFGGGIIIYGEESKRYLCMSKKGKLLAKKRRGYLKHKELCHFTEKLEENYYDSFSHFLHPNWKISINKNGKPKRGPKSTPGQPDTMFLKRPITNGHLVTPTVPSIQDSRYQELVNNKFKKYLSQKRILRYATRSMLSDSPPTPGFEDIFDAKTLPPAYQREMDIRKSMYKKYTEHLDYEDLIEAPKTAPPTSESTSVKSTKRRRPKKNKSKKRKNRKGRKHHKKHKIASSTVKSVIDIDFVPTSKNSFYNQITSITPNPLLDQTNSFTIPSTTYTTKTRKNRKRRRFKNKKTHKKGQKRHRNVKTSRAKRTIAPSR